MLLMFKPQTYILEFGIRTVLMARCQLFLSFLDGR